VKTISLSGMASYPQHQPVERLKVSYFREELSQSWMRIQGSLFLWLQEEDIDREPTAACSHSWTCSDRETGCRHGSGNRPTHAHDSI